MFASSRGASTSSSRQNGLGLMRNMANIRAVAVSAFSPPERSVMFWSLLPGGWAAISTPGFEYVGLFREPELGPSAAEEAREGLLELGVYLVEGRLELLPRRPVYPLYGRVQRVDALREVGLLVEEELVPSFEVVELLEGREAHFPDGRYLLPELISVAFERLYVRDLFAFDWPVLLEEGAVFFLHALVEPLYGKLHLAHLDRELALQFLGF